ncbi:MAG: RrF2 family transcriptional regulator [Clostridia bacterium]|nr:RrF2 family transcriptional regulator [Clostridia bacterium]
MKISTRGRYALRVMIDLAENNTGGYIPLKDVASRQDISQKYLEGIMTDMSKAGMIEALHGKGGGYRLNREPSDYTVGEILRVTEGDLAPVACLAENAPLCERRESCRTLGMWKEFSAMINGFFDRITLADLAKDGNDGGNYVI